MMIKSYILAFWSFHSLLGKHSLLHILYASSHMVILCWWSSIYSILQYQIHGCLLSWLFSNFGFSFLPHSRSTSVFKCGCIYEIWVPQSNEAMKKSFNDTGVPPIARCPEALMHLCVISNNFASLILIDNWNSYTFITNVQQGIFFYMICGSYIPLTDTHGNSFLQKYNCDADVLTKG